MLIKRENCLSKIRPFFDVDIIKVIMGSRRSGKSKVLQLIIDELKNKGVNSKDIIYINFEDLAYDDLNDYKKLYEYVLKNKGNNKQYLFFDEIQHVANFEKAINSFRVAFDCSIFITGSNSKMLSSEISTLLTGRIIEFIIYPFTYKESLDYLSLNGKKEITFNNYLEYGGYPLRFDIDESASQKKYLEELFDNICEKDIFTRDSEIEKEKFLKIAKYVLLNAGSELSVKNICNYLNTQNGGKAYCTERSIYNYLDKMEKCFLIKPIYRYNIPGKKMLSYNPKYYAIDNGMRFICSNGSNYDRGRFFENVILLELLSRDYDVHVGKTYNGEVDFIASKNNKKYFIQVALTMEEQQTIDREFGAFRSIKDGSPKYVISLDPIDMSRDGITHINAIDFLNRKIDFIN